MFKIIFMIMLIGSIGISVNQAYSQEIGLSTFQESAQVIIDEKIYQKTTTSITLFSSNIQEILIPIELEQKIRENQRIEAIILTNENNCVLGVVDQSCIIINISRNPDDAGINAIQDSTKKIADSYIDEINELFDTNAEFFQVFIHTSDKSNEVFETSGIISGTGTISAVYTMPMEDTDSMYGQALFQVQEQYRQYTQCQWKIRIQCMEKFQLCYYQNKSEKVEDFTIYQKNWQMKKILKCHLQ